MTSVLLGRTASYYLALEARGPTVHSLERAVQAVEVVGPIFLALENAVEELETSVEELETSMEEVDTVVEAVAGSVWPPRCWRRSSIVTAHSTMMRWGKNST